MKIVLAGLAFLAAGLGGLVFIAGESAHHEIEALILFLMAAVFFAAGAVIDAIKAAQSHLEATIGKAAIETKMAPPAVVHQRDEVIETHPTPDPTVSWLSTIIPPTNPEAAAEDEQSARAIYIEAKQQTSAGQTEKAIAALRHIIQAYPNTFAATKARKSLGNAGYSV